jgi:hypothetical protein
MPTPSESRVTVSGKPSKAVEMLRKRLRQPRRVVVAVVACVAVAATALAIWWLNSLNGLPDIGDPFDVAAFRAFRIADDQNAFAFLFSAPNGPDDYSLLDFGAMIDLRDRSGSLM